MSAIEQLDAIDRYLNKNWLDEDYPAGEIYNELSENATLKAQIAELEALRKENAALLVAIEAKNAAIQTYHEQYPHMVKGYLLDALALSPSTELLEARDRKHDAKLLRAAWNRESRDNEQLIELAAARESGKWIPELGD